MNCDIYKATNHKSAYIFVESGAEVLSVVNRTALKKLGHIEFFKSISFDENSPLIAANPKEVIKNIRTHGFHIQGADIKIKVEEVSEAGAAIGGGILATSFGFGPIVAVIAAVIGFLMAIALREVGKDES